MNARFVLLALVASGCCGSGDDDDGGGPSGDIVLEAAAQGTHPTEDLSATCSLGLLLTEWEETGGGWNVFASGEVFRTLQVGTNGGEFSALVGGAGTFTESGSTVTAELFGDQSGAVPFWVTIETLTGTVSGERLYAGGWDCAPLDTQFGPG